MQWFLENYSIIAIVFFLVIAVISHLLTPSTYNWKENSISELAAQKYSNRWIMQLGLFGFGVILGSGIVMKLVLSTSLWYLEVPIFAYAVSMSLSGVFSTKPFVEDDDYSHLHDKAHSLFANLTGISFSLGVAMRMIFSEFFADFILNTMFLVIVLLLSTAFSRATENRGIIQRGIFFLGFLWLVVVY
ncbi:MAG: DUF998 domain-containing protein [Candidatus Thorarchaeota archaeon]